MNNPYKFTKEILLRALNACCTSPACDGDGNCDKCILDDKYTNARGRFSMDNKFLNVLYGLIEKEMVEILNRPA